MTVFFVLLAILLFANLMEDSQREHDEFMAEMDAWFDRMEAKLRR